jgi:hypothetical protein
MLSPCQSKAKHRLPSSRRTRRRDSSAFMTDTAYTSAWSDTKAMV